MCESIDGIMDHDAVQRPSCESIVVQIVKVFITSRQDRLFTSNLLQIICEDEFLAYGK